MHELVEYKKLTSISCQHKPSDKHTLCFQVKLEQHQPHRIFKYEVVRLKQELINLYDRLEQQIFDFDNPFNKNIISNLTKVATDEMDTINESLKSCTNRLDVLTHKQFVLFFSLQVHYPDFIDCLDEEKTQKRQSEHFKKIEQKQDSKTTEQFCTDRPWIKTKVQKQNVVEKQHKDNQIINDSKSSSFQKMICMLHQQSSNKLETQQGSVLDCIHLSLSGNKLIFLLEECKQTTKLKNIFKTFFNQNHVCGYISIHKKQGDKYCKRHVTPLHAEPMSMQYDGKTNMLMVMTTLGVYIYLAQMDKRFEQIELFGNVQLPGVCDFCVNPSIGEIYLLRRDPTQQLQSYNINKEFMLKTQFKYHNPSSICFEEIHSRLYVSDQQGIYVYGVQGTMEIKKLHVLTFDSAFQKLIYNHGYLFAISELGSMTVIELKQPQKQKLISVVTRIDLPSKTTNLVGSLTSQRLMISNYRDCVVLIDTIEGPIYSHRQKGENIKKVMIDREGSRLLSITSDGWLATFRLNQKIK